MSTATEVDVAPPTTAARTRGLEALYSEQIDRAVRLAYLLTGDEEVAQDLAHDAFVRLAGRWHDIRHRDAFPSYLRAAIVNLSRSYFRRLGSRRAYIKRQAQAAPQFVTMPDVEGRDEMWRALQNISRRRRAALVLRYYEDLTEREIADVLGCSVAAVKSLIARGLRALRTEVRGDG